MSLSSHEPVCTLYSMLWPIAKKRNDNTRMNLKYHEIEKKYLEYRFYWKCLWAVMNFFIPHGLFYEGRKKAILYSVCHVSACSPLLLRKEMMPHEWVGCPLQIWAYRDLIDDRIDKSHDEKACDCGTFFFLFRLLH